MKAEKMDQTPQIKIVVETNNPEPNKEKNPVVFMALSVMLLYGIIILKLIF